MLISISITFYSVKYITMLLGMPQGLAIYKWMENEGSEERWKRGH
jgi:hypothetical protein